MKQLAILLLTALLILSCKKDKRTPTSTPAPVTNDSNPPRTETVKFFPDSIIQKAQNYINPKINARAGQMGNCLMLYYEEATNAQNFPTKDKLYDYIANLCETVFSGDYNKQTVSFLIQARIWVTLSGGGTVISNPVTIQYKVDIMDEVITIE